MTSEVYIYKYVFIQVRGTAWLEKGSTELFVVVNSYPTAECDYQIQQSNLYCNFPSNDGDRIKLCKRWQPNKKIHILAIG